MKRFLIFTGWLVILTMIGCGIAVIASSQATKQNADIRLEAKRKVLGVQVDDNYRLFVTTRTMRDDESPDTIQIYLFPGNHQWTIEESR